MVRRPDDWDRWVHERDVWAYENRHNPEAIAAERKRRAARPWVETALGQVAVWGVGLIVILIGVMIYSAWLPG